MLANVVAHFRQQDPGHACFINMLPIDAGADEAQFATYITAVQPFALSYDHYSYLADGTDEPTFFNNLAAARKASAAHRLPFWSFSWRLSISVIEGRRLRRNDAKSCSLWFMEPRAFSTSPIGLLPTSQTLQGGDPRS